MKEIDFCPTYTGCLDKLHFRSIFIIACLKHIESRGFSVGKCKGSICNFFIFEVILRGLNIIEFAISR